ncbi:MAG: YihA family ribosome biogenesis GTP-binding protein [Bacteroidetes bacterium]|nr:MAG: YihA family ribosome biogenesis GTP-binding protein [Bacteroidota bacterium]
MKGELNITSIKYEGSFPNEKTCPKSTLPEYAFIGRSNVGKSSLINMISDRKEIARVSKSPGKTRSINIYCVNKSWNIADLPGYGYAKVSKTDRKKWQKMIEEYMLFRPNLVMAFVLIDLRHDLQAIDQEFIDWLGVRQVPFAIVYTKSDKIKPPKVETHVKAIEDALLTTWEAMPPSFITSAVTRIGQEVLLQYIVDLNSEIKENS